MSCGVPALPNGTPAWAISFGSIGTLRPAEPAIFVQIGVSMTPGWTVLTRNPVARCRTLHCDRFCEQAHPSFGGAVAGQAGRAPETGYRRHDYDRAAAGAAHCRHRIFDRQKHTVEVYCGLPPPVGQRHLDRPAQDADPGIGHHHVQTSKAPFDGFDYWWPILLDTDVLVQIDRLAPGAADLLHQCLTSGIVQVGYDEFGAFSRE